MIETKLAKAKQEDFLQNKDVEALNKITEQQRATFFQTLELSTMHTKNSDKKEL